MIFTFDLSLGRDNPPPTNPSHPLPNALSQKEVSSWKTLLGPAPAFMVASF